MFYSFESSIHFIQPTVVNSIINLHCKLVTKALKRPIHYYKRCKFVTVYLCTGLPIQQFKRGEITVNEGETSMNGMKVLVVNGFNRILCSQDR